MIPSHHRLPARSSHKAAKIVQELKNRGWTNMKQILLFSSADDAALYTTGGKDLNGMQPPSLSTNYYDAVCMIKRAIESTGVTGDPKKLKEERKKKLVKEIRQSGPFMGPLRNVLRDAVSRRCGGNGGFGAPLIDKDGLTLMVGIHTVKA
jgi:hypothetical protein